MKNVQSFQVIRFLTKLNFALRGCFTPPTVWSKTPPWVGNNAPPPLPQNLTEQFALNNYSKIRVQTEFLLKIKNNYDVINVFRKVIIIFVTDNDKLINKV